MVPPQRCQIVREKLQHSVMKFDRSNKFDLCYYGQVNSLRLKSSVPSKMTNKHFLGYHLFCWRWYISQSLFRQRQTGKRDEMETNPIRHQGKEKKVNCCPLLQWLDRMTDASNLFFYFFEGLYFQENFIWKTSIFKTKTIKSLKEEEIVIVTRPIDSLSLT